MRVLCLYYAVLCVMNCVLAIFFPFSLISVVMASEGGEIDINYL